METSHIVWSTYYYEHFNLIQHGIVSQKLDKVSQYNTNEGPKGLNPNLFHYFFEMTSIC